jgi:PAS domain S-box-containing protein
VVAHDVASDPLWSEFRELAATHGIGACWSTPILSASGEVLGTFALYYGEPRVPEPAHMEVIEAGTHLARTAIEHARFEQALARREAQLGEAQHMAQLGSWELDIATGVMTWSEGLFRVLGIEAGEVRPSVEALLERVHPSDRARAHAIITTAMQDSRPFSVEQRVIRPDGSVRLVQARGHVLVDDAGVPPRISGTKRDLTELKCCARRPAGEPDSLRAGAPHRRGTAAQSAAGRVGEGTRARHRGALPARERRRGRRRRLVRRLPLAGEGIAFVIGDVVGRGLAAAATMGQLRIALGAYALVDPSPARVIARLSDLVESLGHGEMTTAVYGVYEPSTGTMRVLYTDGLVERRRTSLDEGLLSLAEAARTSEGDGGQLCEHLLERMLGDGSSGDDVALLVLEPVLCGEA